MKKRKVLSVVLAIAFILAFTFSPTLSFAKDKYLNGNLAFNGAKPLETEGLVAHWEFDNNLKDSTQFQNDGVNIGNITFVDGVFGKGAKFDGKSYIEVKDSDSLDVSNNFTFSVWVYKEHMGKKGVPFIVKMNEEEWNYPYTLWEWNYLEPEVTFNDGDDWNNHKINSDVKVDIQKWTLLTATYDGTTVKIYNNNELVKSVLDTSAVTRSSKPLYIGFGNIATEDCFYNGVMDDLRIYNRPLSYEDVGNLYKAGTTGDGKDLVIKPNRLVGFYRFDGNYNDLSLFKNDGTPVNVNDGITFADAIAGKGAKFNGSSYISVKDSDSLDLDRAFTFGLWIYKDNANDNQPIFTKYGESRDENKKGYSYSLYDSSDSTGQRLELMNFADGTNRDNFDTSIVIPNGRWYYYTATYDGKNVKLYIDGVLKQTMPFTGDISNACEALWIGATTDSVFFKGIMDELRIYNYALTPERVKVLYNLRDKMEITANSKLVLTALKTKQNVQLNVNSITYMFTSPSQAFPEGIDELNKINVTSKAAYKSSNTKVVTITKTGKLTAVGKGKSTIRVAYGRFIQNVSVVVK